MEVGRGEGIVDDDENIFIEGVGYFGRLLDIDQLHGRVAGCFYPNQLGVLFKGLLEVLGAGQIGKLQLDPVLFFSVVSQVAVRAAIDIIE